jgi:hypothetical protein
MYWGAGGFSRIRECAQFLDRTEADPVGLPESAIDRPRFGDAHLRAMDKRGNISRICVAVTDEASRTAAFVNDGFKYPSTRRDIGEFFLKRRSNSTASPSRSQLKEARVRYVPTVVDASNFSKDDRELIPQQ